MGSNEVNGIENIFWYPDSEIRQLCCSKLQGPGGHGKWNRPVSLNRNGKSLGRLRHHPE
jgi:hypothetical protein